jgi:hypothetical protein
MSLPRRRVSHSVRPRAPPGHKPTRSAGSSTSSSTIHQSKSERRKARIRVRAVSSRLPGSGVARPSAWAARVYASSTAKREAALLTQITFSGAKSSRTAAASWLLPTPAGPDRTSGGRPAVRRISVTCCWTSRRWKPLAINGGTSARKVSATVTADGRNTAFETRSIRCSRDTADGSGRA